MIDGKDFFDQPVKSGIRKCDNIRYSFNWLFAIL